MSGIKFIRGDELLKGKVNHKVDTVKEIILKKGVVPNLLQLAKVKFIKGDKIEKHFHESIYEIFYVISGELLLIENNESTRAASGDTFVISPKQYHSLEILQSTELIYFNLEEKTWNDDFRI